MTNKFNFVLVCFISALLFCSTIKAESTNTSTFNGNSGFIEEVGQFKMFDNLRFYWHNDNLFVYFLTDKVVFITQEISHVDNIESLEAKSKGDDNLSKKLSAVTTARRFDLIFENTNSSQSVLGENILNYKTDYYLGHCPNGILDVLSYAKIRYPEIYPGIDLVFYLDGKSLKYEFIVNTGANPNDIVLQWDGVENLRINSAGEIDFSVGSFDFTDKAPVSFSAGSEVLTKYRIDDNSIRFNVNQYDENQTLVIDPGLIWASSLEYNGYGSWGALVSNSVGDFYSVDWEWNPGLTDLTNYLASAGSSISYGADMTNNDIVISKFSPTGNLLWVCKYGGSGDDDVNGGVALDDNDNLFIAGTSQKEYSAPSGNFPLQTLVGAFNLAWVGTSTYTRGYLLEFTSANTRKWSTYLDNGATLEVFDIASGLNNDIYIAGKSGSTLASAVSIPMGTGYQGAYTSATSSHNFIMRFNSSGALTWSTWCPGTTNSTGRISDIAIDKSNGDVYMMGDDLWSATYVFSTALISAPITYMGSDDMFYMKFNTSNQPVPSYGKYFGGAGFDKINIGAANGDIELDQYGNLYACGHTYSANFPVVNPGGCAYYDGVINDGSGITANVAGTQDGYLVKINPSGAISYCTFFGGTAYSSMKQLKTDSHNNLWICGQQIPAGLATIAHTDYYNQFIAGTSANIMLSQLSTDDHMEWLSYYGYSGYSEYLGFDIFEVNNDNLSLYLSGDFNNFVNTGVGYQFTSTSCSGAAIFNHVLSAIVPDTITPVVGAMCNVSALTVSGTLPVGATWTWYTGSCGGTLAGTGATLNISPVVTTTYYVMAVGPCVISNCSQITVTPPVIPTISVTNSSICVGQNTTLSESSGFSSYDWSTGSTGNSITVSPLVNTTYSLTVTDSNGCTTTATAAIVVNSTITPSFADLGPYCVGDLAGSLSATSTNAISGTWSPTTINTASAGTTVYTFTPTVGQCASTTTMSVTITAGSTPSFVALGPYCVGTVPGSLSATSTNAITGTWSPTTISTGAAGTTIYTFTPTAGQCAAMTTMSVTVNSNITPTFTALGPYCVGAAPAALSANSTNGITGTWSPATISTASTGATVYTFAPTAGQCATTATMTVNVNLNTLPTFTALGSYCAGATPAVLPLTSNNGISGTWSPSSINTASAGTTVYTFSPATGQCAVNTTMSVTIDANVTSTFTGLGPYCEAAVPGLLPANSNNGFSGTWSPLVISTAAAGTAIYTFTPTAGQCATSNTMSVTIDANITPTFFALGPYCQGTTAGTLPTISNNGINGTWSPSVINTISSGTTIYTFTPTAGQCAVSTTMSVVVDSDIVASFTALGPYCVGETPGTLSSTSNNGINGVWSPAAINTGSAATTIYTFTPSIGQCSLSSTTMSVVLNSNPSINLTINSEPLCFGDNNGKINVSVVNGSPDYNINWTTGSTLTNQTNYIITTLSSGIVNVTVTDSNSCADSTNINLTEPLELSANVIEIDPLCNGTSGSASVVVLGGTPVVQIMWQDGNISLSNADIPANTPFGYTLTDVNSCTYSGSVLLTEPDLFEVQIAGTDILCYGEHSGSAVVTSVTGCTYPITYLWNTGDVNLQINNLGAGTYTITVEDFNNCEASAQVLIIEPEEILVDVTVYAANCSGAGGGASLSVSGGVSPYNYLWENGETSTSVSALAPGIYPVTVTDKNNCMIIANANITSSGTISAQINVNQGILCFGEQSGILQASSPDGHSPFNFHWSNGVSLAQNSNLGAETYIVTVTDGWGCVGTASQLLIEPSRITVTENITHIGCAGDTDGAIYLNVLGGTPFYTYLWSDGSNLINVTNLNAGNYTVTILDSNNCTVIENFTINSVNMALQIIQDVTQIMCFGNENGRITLNGIGGTEPYTFHVSGTNYNQSGTEFINLATGEYHIHLTDDNGCTDESTAIISAPGVISGSFEFKNPSCYGNNDGYIEVIAYGGTEPYMFMANGIESPLNVISGLLGGNYLLDIIDINGCKVRIGRANLYDDPFIDCISIPNAFSPNSDGVNDVWIIENIGLFPNATIKVYNRWGQELFQSRGDDNPWNGTFNGKFLPAGSYLYVVNTYKNTKPYVGIVTIVY